MAKSRAEIQKAYRQRQKEKHNELYLAKERERRRRSYIPNDQLSNKKKNERNQKNREYLKKYRKKKKAETLNHQGVESEASTSGYESNNRLIVRIGNPHRANGPRMRITKELDKARKEVKEMKEKFENLKRKYRSTMRTIQRKKRKTCSSPSTPRSKAAKTMQNLKMTPKQKSSIYKELVFANAICDEIKSSAKKAPLKRKRSLQNLIVGDIVKKYKVIRKLGARTGMSRNKMAKVTSKELCIKSIARKREVAMNRKSVVEFFERDDNSRNMPGKADYVKPNNKEKTQKRVLTDYLSNLYAKFLSENKNKKLSFASFCRIRPSHIILTSLITRDTCLCTRHQNMSLTLKAAKRENVDTPIRGEKMLERKVEILEEIKEKVSSEKIKVGQWKRVQIDNKGQVKTVMKIVDTEMTKDDFLKHAKTQVDEFENHVQRINTQYSQMKHLKEILPANHFIVHMDFSENFSCKSFQEIQSAYWNQTSVTLHPIVVYYRLNDSEELVHKSMVIISDEMGHNASTVLTFIDRLIPELKCLNSNIMHIHYWTDGPTSQYRNKAIFHAVSNHTDTYGMSATWNYWEAGHGKGPCDGLGGTVKRMADDAIKAGKVAIQDPFDFFAWTQSTHCTMKTVKFIFVSSETCKVKTAELAKLKLKPVIGTMKLHAVKGKGGSVVATRETSCYCDICIKTSTCDSWKDVTTALATHSQSSIEETTVTVPLGDKSATSPIVPQDLTLNSILSPTIHENQIQVSDFVAAIYLNEWYIGKVINVDEDDNTYEISFLEKKKKSFQWPTRTDIIWVESNDILCKISTPKAIGKSKRMLSVDSNDINTVESLFSRR